MKRTPMSTAREVGNRKGNFALIERQRGNALGNVSVTLRHEMSRYVTRYRFIALPSLCVRMGSDHTLISHLISDTTKEKNDNSI